MSNKIVNSKNIKNEFFEIKDIQEPYNINTVSQGCQEDSSYGSTEESNITEFLNNITKRLENGSMSSSSLNKNTSREYNTDYVANALNGFFEERENDSFEWYQRAGKQFFRCNHNYDKNHSEEIRRIFETIIEKKMKKEGIHYIVTPNSSSVIFR